jgi:hypothetical protein
MRIRVIGAGIGRTGTTSLKTALELLGFRKCYHMEELANNPSHVPFWMAVAHGQDINWDDIFSGYQAAVDLPTYPYYEELMTYYPDAKVILTVRDPEEWYDSASQTIFRFPTGLKMLVLKFISLFNKQLKNFLVIAPVVQKIGLEDFFGNNVSKENAIRVFNQHNALVQESVPPERLLIFDVKQGWEPLCAFLEVPVPDKPFPHKNIRDEFGSPS